MLADYNDAKKLIDVLNKLSSKAILFSQVFASRLKSFLVVV